MKENEPLQERLAYIFIAVLLSLGGSVKPNTSTWIQSYGNGAHTAHIDTEIVPLVVLWKVIPEYEGISGGISGSPVVSGDWLVVLSPLGTELNDCLLLCFKMDETGLLPLWNQFLSGVERGVTPAIAGNRVICPSNCVLHCFDLETGNTLWETGFYSSPTTPTIVSDNAVAVVTRGRAFSLVDIPSGRIVWTKESLGVQCEFWGAVTAGDGKLFVHYANSDESGIAAFNVEGELLWKWKGEQTVVSYADMASISLYTAGTLFAVDNYGTLFALDGDSGSVLWTYEGKSLLDAFSSDGKNIYVYSKTDEGVLCLDVETGEEIWKSPPLFPGDRDIRIIIDKSVVSTRNCIFVSLHTLLDFDPSPVFALDSKTGNIVWVSENLEDPQGPLILCNDMVIVATTTALIAFGAQSPASPPPSPTLQRPSSFITLLILAGVFAGILVTYFLLRYKKPT